MHLCRHVTSYAFLTPSQLSKASELCCRLIGRGELQFQVLNRRRGNSSVFPDLRPFIGGPFPTSAHQIWNTKSLEPPHSRPVKSTTCCNDIPTTLSNTLPRFPTIMVACGVKIGHRESTMEVLYCDGGVLDVLRIRSAATSFTWSVHS
jgi:hypothetical protein